MVAHIPDPGCILSGCWYNSISGINMRTVRIIWFILSITLGVLIGLILIWGYFPVPYREMALSSLRSDYKTDYVLMVAEIYHMNNDPIAASASLESLGGKSPLQTAQQAVLIGRSLDYSGSDIDQMVRLIESLQAATAEGTPTVSP